jgi:limonene-1,2-epoxide hydrolase
VAKEHEDLVREFLLAFEGEVLGEVEIDAIVGRMAADARYNVFAWQEPFVGRDAIREELLRHAGFTRDGTFEFLNTASVGSVVFVERIDWTTVNGIRAGFHVVGVFDVDAGGKIARWCDYVDSGEIAAKFGAIEDATAPQAAP